MVRIHVGQPILLKKTRGSQSLTQKPPLPEADLKWPYKVRSRKHGPVLAKIYRPCEGQDSYRVAWMREWRSVNFASYCGEPS